MIRGRDYEIHVGDVREKLAELPADSVQCCVTSPPYYGLRDYGIDGQIGLESSLDEFVSTMVDVFRGVRRVLRPDGVVWCNLGDSYFSQQGKGFNGQQRLDDANRNVKVKRPDGIKPKDLAGVPWRVALALQEPMYTGSIEREIDRVWLAAMVDGEGCMFVHKRGKGLHAGGGYKRKSDTFGAGLEVCNTNRDIIQKCHDITGVGCVQTVNKHRTKTLYRWHVRSNQAKSVIREIYPYLVAKQHEARLVFGCPANGVASDYHAAILELRKSGDVAFDAPPPPSMFEQGWWLRDAVIWKKPSPMPGSQRDRCTSAYEFIFQLTRNSNYYWDMEAVREPLATPAHSPGNCKAGDGHKRNDLGTDRMQAVWGANGRIPRNVWTIASEGFSEAHFATFPVELPVRCIKASTSAIGACPECGAPWGRVVEREFLPQQDVCEAKGVRGHVAGGDEVSGQGWDGVPRGNTNSTTTGWRPTCDHEHDRAAVVPCMVLDPFSGAGTTGVAALQLGRRYIGIELNPEYAEMSQRRIQASRTNDGRPRMESLPGQMQMEF